MLDFWNKWNILRSERMHDHISKNSSQKRTWTHIINDESSTLSSRVTIRGSWSTLKELYNTLALLFDPTLQRKVLEKRKKKLKIAHTFFHMTNDGKDPLHRAFRRTRKCFVFTFSITLIHSWVIRNLKYNLRIQFPSSVHALIRLM